MHPQILFWGVHQNLLLHPRVDNLKFMRIVNKSRIIDILKSVKTGMLLYPTIIHSVVAERDQKKVSGNLGLVSPEHQKISELLTPSSFNFSSVS